MNAEDIGKKAALLSIVEIGLGSFLHAFSVPFAGHFLSLNQGFILTRAAMESRDRRSPGIISAVAALLKSLSPVGKKLTPMLAIGMQGQLYNLGLLLLGNNGFGRILGMSLLCVWGFIQPLALYFILYGKTLVEMAEYYSVELSKVFTVSPDDFISILLSLVVFKIICGVVVVILAQILKQNKIEQYETWLISKHKPQEPKREGSPWLLALKDLFSPVFIVTWILMLLFYLYSQHERAELIWVLLRPVAVGYLIFLGLRIFPVERIVPWVSARFPFLGRALESALKYIK
ncbi:MAG: hypothetical protein V4598_18525 [Bdellovibrionota bacterium]